VTEQHVEPMGVEPQADGGSDDVPDDVPAPLDRAAVPAPRRDGAEAADSADSSLLNLIDRLSALLDRTELTELEVRVGATGLVLRKPSALAPSMPPAVQVAAPAVPGAGAPAGAPGAAADAGPAARLAVMAPLSGIWYGAPAPGSAPYVTLGGEVAVGQVIGLIEAMKLFNEIKSDRAGRVVKIHAEDGKLVRAKQPLIEVDPL
jgi:acetyl-CoA carboxylase biotin carboxyl carrier protein